MIKIGILGDIGSGKSFVANSFGYPVFNADFEVSQLYRKNKKTFKKLKKILPKYFHTFPVNKAEVSKAILANKSNLNKINIDTLTNENEKLKSELINLQTNNENLNTSITRLNKRYTNQTISETATKAG